VVFGDFDGVGNTDYEGASFWFNPMGSEDTGSLTATYTKFHLCSLFGPKDHYTVISINSCDYSIFRDCLFSNIQEFITCAHLTIENCVWSGGRYLMAFPEEGLSINGLKAYGISTRPFFLRDCIGTIDIKGIVLSATFSQTVNQSDKYGSVGGGTFRIINISYPGYTTPNWRFIDSGPNYWPNIVFGFTMNLKVLDYNGNPDSTAVIKVYDNQGTEVVNESADSDGMIDEQVIIYRTHKQEAGIYYVTDDNDWDNHYPLTLTVNSAKGQPFSTQLIPIFDMADKIITNGIDWTIQLASPVYVSREISATIVEDVITGKI
jgi:hypothetical protein